MKRKWVTVFLESFLVLLLVQCGSADIDKSQASVSSLTNTASSTSPSHIPTATITQTQEPRWTPAPLTTTTFLPLPTDAIQPTPLFTPAFPATPSGLFHFGSPTPLATAPEGSYQLQSWTEAEWLALIRNLNQTAYLNDYHFAGDFRGEFLAYQQIVKQAAREFLLHYPNSADPEQVEWLLAFANTLDRRDSDEWVVEEIAQRLNNGWLDPPDLNSGLEPLGFEAYKARLWDGTNSERGETASNPILNLFGDDRPAIIWRVESREEGYYGHGMFVAVQQLADNSFRVALIYSQHLFPYSGGMYIDARELTGDGQPELVVTNWGCEGGCRVDGVYVYQWQEDHFVEIARGNFGSASYPSPDSLSWEYGLNRTDNSPYIGVTNFGLYPPTFSHTLTWNGEWLQIGEWGMEIPEPEALRNDVFQDWIGYVMEYAEFNGTQSLFDYVLENPPEEMGVAFPDFIRFQIAMVDMFKSRVGPASEQLQSIVDSPTDPAKPLVADAATVFLEEHKSTEDTYRSCYAANLEVEHSLLSFNTLSSTRITDEWGLRLPSSLCSPRAAFRLLLGQLDLQPGDDIIAKLRAAGVPVLRSIKADLDGDQLDDWLVVVDTPGSERRVEAWAFVNSGKAYITIPVFGYRSGFFAKFFIYPTNNLIKLDTFSFPGEQHPATVLQVGEVMYLFSVHHKDQDVDVQHLLTVGDIESFQIDPDSSKITATYSAEAYDPYHDVFAWREGLGRFLNLSQIDQLIFEKGDPGEAIPVIEEKLATLKSDERRYNHRAPQLFYMLGLAYELNGNSSAAVEAYLKVWREFPGSPYALIAREKIQ